MARDLEACVGRRCCTVDRTDGNARRVVQCRKGIWAAMGPAARSLFEMVCEEI